MFSINNRVIQSAIWETPVKIWREIVWKVQGLTVKDRDRLASFFVAKAPTIKSLLLCYNLLEASCPEFVSSKIKAFVKTFRYLINSDQCRNESFELTIWIKFRLIPCENVIFSDFFLSSKETRPFKEILNKLHIIRRKRHCFRLMK